VASFASVYVSKADALASWTRNIKPAFARCLAYFFRKGVEQDGGKVTIVSQGRIAFPKVAPRTAVFRIATRVTVVLPGKPAVTLPFTIHVIALGQGRGDAGLVLSGFGSGLAAADLRFFAKLTAARMVAAKL
jgi:hypothetical protein